MWLEGQERLFTPKIESRFWKKSRTWRKLLLQEPIPTLLKYRDELYKSNDVRAKYLGHFCLNIVLSIVISKLYAEEFQQGIAGSNYSVIVNLANAVNSTIAPATDFESIKNKVEEWYDLNSPVRIGCYYADIFLSAGLGHYED